MAKVSSNPAGEDDASDVVTHWRPLDVTNALVIAERHGFRWVRPAKVVPTNQPFVRRRVAWLGPWRRDGR